VSSHDVKYYRQRAVTERELAQEAGRDEVRIIHEELAQRYEALAAQSELRPTLRIVS
jgi:hypothetical protein